MPSLLPAYPTVEYCSSQDASVNADASAPKQQLASFWQNAAAT
jgi:hypothetical protein